MTQWTREMSFLSRIFGDVNQRYLKSLQPLVEKINAREGETSSFSDEKLRLKTGELKERLAAGEALDDLLPEAFALVREAASRTLGERHFDVQLLGGIVLHQGKIAEMKTGEGKTLVCTLPAYLNALSGRGVHIVTVNDYLARRDAVWMGQIYDALGLSVGVINHEASYLYDSSHREVDEARDAEGSYRVFYQFLRPASRTEAYLADVVYGTNNEYGFDYLRDNLAYYPSQVAQVSLSRRPRHHFAVVDEVDSILIDEARTPLIISAPAAEAEDFYRQFARIAGALNQPEDFTVDEKTKSAILTEAGIEKAERLLGIKDIYTERGVKYVHHLETAVRAKAIFQRDRDYVVRDGEVIIVDEFTGRLQPGRRWSEGLHQAIEAKEGVALRQESRTLASITFQNYFKLYEKLSGMTGTAMTSSEEFLKVYGLETVSVPTNRPSQRLDRDDLIFQTEKGKFQAICRKVKELQERGQPVLVGTVSIEKNERLSEHFRRSGIVHKVLNAKNHEEEGLVIAGAGARRSVVLATNMAGRGVDIKLGGANAAPEDYEAVKDLGGLCVIGTERHEARRIDDQLRGRSGRQGDPGASEFFVSLEDDLSRVFAAETVKKMMGRFGIPEDEAINHRLVSRAIESAQQKIEGFNFDLRKHLLDYDNILNHQRSIIYERRRRILFGDERDIAEVIREGFRRLGATAEKQKEAEEILVKKKTELGAEEFLSVGRQLFLQVVDLHWMDHLETMEYLRSSVRLRAYGQRDPLIEYKKEGLTMFRRMEESIFSNFLRLLPTLGARTKEDTPAAPSSSVPKVGRNDPCPCRSGKKYKKCHGA